MGWRHRRGEDEFTRANSAVRYLLVEASGLLSSECTKQAEELLRVGEPDLALEFMAWDLAPHADELPEHLVRFIKEEVGDAGPMPPAFEA
ncbi:hypothetical protein SAMN05660748_3939 [Blastococcus aggregatus]|uniref:Uncharacterized protein n=1 Tax=Blastococcus aggregatus TaxID=38502 RepID=A0A285VER5_9ACTN|nr:hypothetical protein [Blastococcus aggregatus]SOC52058.1 hypothetical protein SAMN05660748_3939 [Blastococcus aggregatus]